MLCVYYVLYRTLAGNLLIFFWYHMHDKYAQGLHDIRSTQALTTQTLAHRGYINTLDTQALTTQTPKAWKVGVQFSTPSIILLKKHYIS